VTLVACSRYVEKGHVRAAFFSDFRSVTIYNAVNAVFDAPREQRHLMSKDSIRIGMVARLDSIKDHVTLINAMPQLLKEWPNLQLEFAGSGNLLRSLMELSVEIGVAKNVIFSGSVSDVPALLQKWDIYLHSTTPNEGMGTAVAEAMMAGLPCIVSDIEVMREVGGPHEVVYTEPGAPNAWAKSIGALLADQPKRTALGSAAQIRARNLFSSESVAKAYLDILIPHD
jgi:glycosyltransferase involved in cell wall biosynthesis